MGIPSMPELLVILVVVLLVFGHKKLPEIGNGLGRAIQNFKKATTEPDEIDITPQASRPKEKSVNEDPKA